MRGIKLNIQRKKIKNLSNQGNSGLERDRAEAWLVLVFLNILFPVGSCLSVLAMPATAQIPSGLQDPMDDAVELPEESQSLVDYQETPYTLGPGDGISINVFNIPEYSGQYRVAVDGRINLPIVGSVDLQGLTIPQATNLITQKYAPVLQRPIINVTLVAPRPIRIAIAGEVNQPGSYTLSIPGASSSGEGQGAQQFPHITEAIKQAGGITPSANVRQVKLRRVLQGERYILNVNLWELVQEGEIIQDVTLRDGDTIFIPTVAQNNARETRFLGQSAIAPAVQSVEVAVVGEVVRPGSHQISGGDSRNMPTVTQAIQAAGGITNLSDIRNIKVERVTRTGTEEVLSANLWNLLKAGDVEENVILQSGDRIIVPKAETVNPNEAEALASASFSPQTIRVNVIGEAERTGTLELPANTPLNQAILAAGGFNNRADKGEVELVRLNPNGTVTRREVEINLDQGINSARNPILRNNDVIVVERSTLASISDSVSNVLQPVTTIFQGIRFFEIFLGDD